MKKDSRTWGERIVDNLMDKLADKISATEMIKANAAAEAAETERLRTQVVQYQHELEEIRKKADELKSLISDLAGKVNNSSKAADNEETKKNLELLSKNIDESSKKLIDSLAGDFEDSNKAIIEAVRESVESSNKALIEALDKGVEDNNKTLVDALSVGLDDKNKDFIDQINKRLDEEHKYTHDIGVQVYRNVQASAQDENKKLTDDIIKRIVDENDHLAISVADETSGQLQRTLEGLSEKQKELDRKIEALHLATDKNHACTTVSVITLIAVLAGIAVNVLNILGILRF